MYTDLTRESEERELVCTHILEAGAWVENSDRYQLSGVTVISKIGEGLFAVQETSMEPEEHWIYKGEIK